ncbi:MAG TPA: hypothetical protein VIK59_12960 [Verrucomicrobiae bacterium]
MKSTSKLLLTPIVLLGLVTAAMNANASITISGSDLNSLHYSGDPGDAQYVAGTPDVAQLTTPDSGLNGDAPAVYVRASNPLATSSLSTLSALDASYSLFSSSGGNGNPPYWLTYLTDPNTSGLIGVVSFGGPTLNGSSQIHVFYDNDPGALSSDDYWGDTLSTLDGTAYGTTTFGQLEVFETGVEIGDWDNAAAIIPASANIDSITISSVPEPTTIIAGAMLLLPFGLSTLRILRRNRIA